MGVGIGVQLKGLREAQQKLERAAQEMSGDALFNAVRDGTLIVQRQAKIDAPVRYGFLRASIIPSISASGGVVEGIVGTTIEYAGFQEFGTRYITGKHYMGNALEDNRDRIVAMIMAAIKGVWG